MELPFAVEASTTGIQVVDTTTRSRGHGTSNTNLNSSSSSSLQQSESSSLVTASSQGSFMNSSFPLPPNTPQDVVLPTSQHQYIQQPRHLHQQEQPCQLVVTPQSNQQQQDLNNDRDPEADFTYVNVTETDADDDADGVDILLEGVAITMLPQDEHQQQQRGDVLSVLLGGMTQQSESDNLLNQLEAANEAVRKANEAKRQGDLMSALEYHTQAAKLYKDNALAIRDRNSSLASSLLLLSQTQAKSAIALKGIVNLNPTELRQILPPSSGKPDTTSKPSVVVAQLSHKERLRAAVRGALGSRHPHEADISDSQFLGRAGSNGPVITTAGGSSSSSNNYNTNISQESRNETEGTLLTEGQETSVGSVNPVDDMMELERELRDMDMALELGNSISSLDSRMQHRMKNSMVDGSFMVVPPGSNSYMASSMWGSGHVPSNATRPTNPGPSNSHGIAGVRARANRVQSMLDASTAAPSNRPSYQAALHTIAQSSPTKNTSGLESSWWGNSSTNTSQLLASSMISMGGRIGVEGDNSGAQSSANTKQIMRLMDSMKTLGEENAALLREVEELEAARAEATAARESMKKFKAEYGKRFASLKKALEKFRQDHPSGNTAAGTNPVSSSDFMQTASVSDQLQRQEQLIRKLTADLKKEKDESKKKDAALRKYESFYREVKARSAQKAAQRQMENQQQQQRQNARPRNIPRSTHK